jgi:hypothetical protein
MARSRERLTNRKIRRIKRDRSTFLEDRKQPIENIDKEGKITGEIKMPSAAYAASKKREYMRNTEIDTYTPKKEIDRDLVIRYLEDLSAKSRYKYIKRAIQLVIREIMYEGPAMTLREREMNK